MTAAPALDADLVAGLKRLKLAQVRAIAPEVLQTPRTQRWKPEEILRVLVDAEIAARDDSNARMRLRAAGFPVAKTLEEFNTSLSSIPQSTFDYLASLEWIRASENLCPVGPAGTAKSHLLLALGHAAVTEGLKVRYFAAADLVENLYRGLADNSVAKIIDNLLRADLVIIDELGFAPLGLAGTQLLFRFVAATYERRSLGIASHWPFDAWGRPARTHHRRFHARPAPPPRRRRRHRRRELPHATSQDPRRTPHNKGLIDLNQVGTFAGHQRGLHDGR